MSDSAFIHPERVGSRPTTGVILMVRPAAFGFNPETAQDNVFQHISMGVGADEIANTARAEFDQMVAALHAAGVEVIVIEDTPEPEKTDAVFPNNWLSTHTDGVLVTYPMLSEIRRLERRPEIISLLQREFAVSRVISLESWEQQNRILEGTGSLVLDRENRIAYAGLSQRTDAGALAEWCELMQYRQCAFTATDPQGRPIYHTNVMMGLGGQQVIVCLACIPDEAERQTLQDTITATGKEIVAISFEQVLRFAGNALEVTTSSGPAWVMSSSAYNSLNEEQKRALESSGNPIIHSPLTTIEAYGGGSARCMLAEIFLPAK